MNWDKYPFGRWVSGRFHIEERFDHGASLYYLHEDGYDIGCYENLEDAKADAESRQ